MTREQLLLVCIAEELGEVGKELLKGVRFGLQCDWYQNQTNLQRASIEWSQLHALLDKLKEEYGHELTVDPEVYAAKRKQFEHYFQHSVENGCVEAKRG